MFVNHTDVRMARTKVKGGLNLVHNLYEMVGKQSQIFRLVGGRALTLFCLPSPVDVPSTARQAPVEAVHNRRDEMHKVGLPPGKDYGL